MVPNKHGVAWTNPTTREKKQENQIFALLLKLPFSANEALLSLSSIVLPKVAAARIEPGITRLCGTANGSRESEYSQRMGRHLVRARTRFPDWGSPRQSCARITAGNKRQKRQLSIHSQFSSPSSLA